MTQATLAFFYADLGDAWWKTAATEMLRSAQRVMPDWRIVQLSPAGTPMHPWAHEIVECKLADDAPHVGKMLSKVKAYMVAQFAAQASGLVVFTDVDVIWTKAPLLSGSGAVAFDSSAAHLPYRQFYLQFHQEQKWHLNGMAELLEELPQSTWQADASELALNMLLDRQTDGPLALPAAETQSFVHHFPGRENRDTMIAFARSLDGGQPFKELDPSYVKPPVREGVNEDLQSIVFNTEPDANVTGERAKLTI